jgi:tripartite-type tricarboxylate transporter receptor subunit TctC
MSNPHLYRHMPFDPFKDLVPVTSLLSNQLVLAVHPSAPATNLREFVELARRNQAAAVLCLDRQRQSASSGHGTA